MLLGAVPLFKSGLYADLERSPDVSSINEERLERFPLASEKVGIQALPPRNFKRECAFRRVYHFLRNRSHGDSAVTLRPAPFWRFNQLFSGGDCADKRALERRSIRLFVVDSVEESSLRKSDSRWRKEPLRLRTERASSYYLGGVSKRFSWSDL